VSSIDEVANIARTYLRDFPKFFQVSFDVTGRTYELGQGNIDVRSFWAASFTTGASAAVPLTTSQYSLDSRNGILRLSSVQPVSTKLLVEGYYYEWVTPEDLLFYSQRAIDKHLPALNMTLDDLSPAAIDTIGIAAICESLWALMTEYSRDIDVITSESIHIPASQRFRMVQSLLSQWEGEYRRLAQALNIGVDRLEVFTLRRTSRTTNRLVPIYRSKEVGDFSPVERLWPEIDSGVGPLEAPDEKLRVDVYVDGDPPQSYVPNTTAYY
jgi:hypothetical protein